MKAALVLFGVALVALVAPDARASVTYPAELLKHWELQTLPGAPPYCTLCHTTDSGGTGTATKPFGRALLAAGALGNNVPSFDGALDALEAAGNDSDRDGVSDLDELRAGTPPNEGEPVPGAEPDPLADVPPPRTGCSFRPSQTGGFSGAVTALLLLASRRRSARVRKESATSRKSSRAAS
jgi:hypothetical protein